MGPLRETLLLVVTCLTAAAGAADGAVTATLTASGSSKPTGSPYLRATLAVHNDGAAAISGVELHADDGGPRMMFPLTAAPGRRTSRTIYLPATQAGQTYALQFRGDGDARPVARTTASIQWSTDRVDSSLYLNAPAVAVFADVPVSWSVEFRKQLLFAGAAVVLVAAFTLLVRGPRLRAGFALVTAVAATVGMVALFNAIAPPNVEQQTMNILHRPARGATTMTTVTVLHARRTARSAFESSARPCPVYADRSQMLADDATVLRASADAGRRRTEVECLLGAGQVRVFTARTPPAANIPRPAVVSMRFDEEADGWLLEAKAPTPQAIWVAADRVARVDAMARHTPRMLRHRQTEPSRRLRQEGERFGFSPDALRLYNWWDRTGRDVGKTYLVWPNGADLYVSTVAIR